MKCYYCNSNIIIGLTKNYVTKCNNCSNTLFYVVNNIIKYISLKSGNHHIMIDVIDNKCSLFYINNVLLTTINYKPNINPKNVNNWINRLLNLSSFH